MLYKLYIILLFYFYTYRQISLLMVKYGYIIERGNFMKKLIYNENTKEINIIDEENIENSKEVITENIDKEELTEASQKSEEQLQESKIKLKEIRNWLNSFATFLAVLSGILTLFTFIVYLKLEVVSSFILSVLAGVVTYYICKWLDSNK